MTGSVLVCFTTPNGRCAVPVEDVLEVRPSLGLQQAGRAREGVVGVLAGSDGALLPVVQALGAGAEHVLVLAGVHGPFGLHVEQVTGLVRIGPQDVGPPPAGQRDGVVAGVVRHGAEVLLLVDPRLLEAVLWPDGRPAPDVTLPEAVLKDAAPVSKDSA